MKFPLRNLVFVAVLVLSATRGKADTCYSDLTVDGLTLSRPLPLDQIKSTTLRADMEQAFSNLSQVVEGVVAANEPATFNNTVDPILTTVAHFDRLMNWRGWLAYAGQEVPAEDLRAKRHAAIYLNRPLYDRLRQIGGTVPLTKEQLFIVRHWMAAAEREGVTLSNEVKTQVMAIDQEIELKTDIFRKNLAAAGKRTYYAPLNTHFDEGIPEAFLRDARERGRAEGRGGYLFFLTPEQLDQSNFVLQYASDENVRKGFFEAYTRRALHPETDNGSLPVEIANLRLRRAQLLGKRNHAETVLPRMMVGSEERLRDFIDSLKFKFAALADAEMAQIADHKQRLTGNRDLPPWDVQYYAKKLENHELNFDMSLLMPYLEVYHTLDRVLGLAEKVYGIKFEVASSSPTWHDDVRVWRVTDRVSKRVLGHVYLDLLSRADKALMSYADEFTPPGRYRAANGDTVMLNASTLINMGVRKGGAGEPSFFTWRQVQSLAHEIGHAVHSLSSEATYASYDSFQVARDFVELPSQLFENWLFQPEVIGQMGRHYQTKAPFPKEWVSIIQKSRNVQPALKTLARRGLMTQMDFAWHTITAPIAISAEKFEAQHQTLWMHHPYLRAISGTGSLHSYIFATRYDSQYHGYQWSEAMDYHVFEEFLKHGLLNDETGIRFRKEILSLGSVIDPIEAYRAFRGEDPDPTAILRKFGR